MKQREFRAARIALDYTEKGFASRLGVLGGKARISEWERGRRAIPTYIAAHVETLLELHAAVEWRDALERGTTHGPMESGSEGVK